MSKSYKDEQKEVKIMDLKNYSTGVQHIGIPTNDIDKTVEFYHKLGFETAFETVNEEANEKVVFLKLGTLVNSRFFYRIWDLHKFGGPHDRRRRCVKE